MKLVFLDFDGVLNGCESPTARANADPTLVPGSVPWCAAQLDHDKVERLNTILERTGAYVVITTSWKAAESFDLLCHILRFKGLKGFILGAIEHIGRDKEGVFYYRADEIEHWLDHVKGVESYVVLDDLDMYQLTPRHVKTETEVGLQDEHVERAIQLLGTPV